MLDLLVRCSITDNMFLSTSNALTRGMSETMAFLESCIDEDMNLLSDELFNVIEAFMKRIKEAVVFFLHNMDLLLNN